jgi:transposase
MLIKQYQIDERRMKVSTLLATGQKQRKVTQALNVSLGTVNSDVRALPREWNNTQRHEMDVAKAIDLECINVMI